MTKSPARISTGRWTPARRETFVRAMAQHGNTSAAAGACGLSRQSAYKLRLRDADFARAWDNAVAGLRARQQLAGALQFQKMIAALDARPATASSARYREALIVLMEREHERGALPSGAAPGLRALDQPVSTGGRVAASGC